MPKVVIQIVENQCGFDHPQITVSDMRKQLACALSKLRGDQLVAFSFIAVIPEYQPAAEEICDHGNASCMPISKCTMAPECMGNRRAYGELAASDPTDQP